MKRISMRNMQRHYRVNSPALRRQLKWLVQTQFDWPRFDIGVCLVSAQRMARLNEEHLGHEGATDVLTFPYSSQPMQAEIYICPDIAQENAEIHDVTIDRELSRYLIHGLLHLSGHDDKLPDQRQRMKIEENRILRILPYDG